MNKEYRRRIFEMVSKIENTRWLIFIYSFIKGITSDEKGGAI